MTLNSWIRKREQGFKSRIGDFDSIHKTIYSSLEPKDTWNDSHDGYTEHGGVFNLEFSLDG